jgi:acyl-CoA thioesterase-2
VPDTLEELIDLLDLETIEVDLYRGRQPDTWLQRVFGGQVAAQAQVAGTRTVDPDRSIHSLHAYFILPGDTALPIVYDVERVRDGRSFSTRRIVARQHGRSIFYMSASFHVTEPGLEHQDVMPHAPPPDDCPRMADLFAKQFGRSPEDWRHEWAALDVRYAGDSRAGGELDDPAHPAQARIWLKAAGKLPDDPVLNAAVFTYASDLTLLSSTLVPHGTHIGAPGLMTASLDHTMWFHRPFRADEWMLYDQISPSAAGGLGFAVGRVFSEDGRLVASVAQEGLIRQGRA